MKDRILDRAFASGFALSFFTYLAVGATIPLLPRLITGPLGGDNADVGRQAAVYSFAAVLSRPLLSLVARRGVRQLALVGSLLGVGGSALLLVSTNIAWVGASRAVAAMAEALVWTASGTVCTARVSEKRQAEAVSLSSAAIFVGLGIGPLLTEPLIKAGNFDGAAWVTIVASSLAAVVGFKIRREWGPTGEVPRGRLTRAELFHPAALLPGLTLAAIILGWSAWSNFIALRADELKLGSAALFFAIYSFLSLTVRLLGARLPERIGLLRCAAGASLSMGGGLIILGAAQTTTFIALGTAAVAVGTALAFPALSAIALNNMRDPSERPLLLSSFGLFFEIGAGFGGLLLGPIARNASISSAFQLGSMCALAGIGGVFVLARHRRPSAPI